MDQPVDQDIIDKISLFCNVKKDCVIENLTLPVLYEAPMMLEKSNLSWIVCRELSINAGPCDMAEWTEMLKRVACRRRKVTIGLVGKYVKLHDAYLSVAEALRHGGYENDAKVEIKWIEAEELTEGSADSLLGDVDGILVPGGFGDRGIEGKILAANFAREHDIPYLGICLGMQTAVIEFARNAAGIEDAHSGEFVPNGRNRVIDLMADQQGNLPKGGTMRLGAYPCRVKEGTLLAKAYGKEEIQERHRHRYEFNNAYREKLEAAGLVISGTSPDGRLVEAVEIPDQRFFAAVQYHPEFKSRPNNAHPLFREFIKASLQR